MDRGNCHGEYARRTSRNFGLTARALAFAKLYAMNPRLGPTQCAIHAKYGVRGARARGNELLRDIRVLRAIIFFSVRSFNLATAEARQNLARLALKEGCFWNGWDHNAFNRLTMRLKGLETRMELLEKIYIREQALLAT